MIANVLTHHTYVYSCISVALYNQDIILKPYIVIHTEVFGCGGGCQACLPAWRVNTGGLSGRPGTIRDNANGFVGKNKPSAYITG